MIGVELLLKQELMLWHICLGHLGPKQLPEGWDSFAITRIYPIEDEE